MRRSTRLRRDRRRITSIRASASGRTPSPRPADQACLRGGVWSTTHASAATIRDPRPRPAPAWRTPMPRTRRTTALACAPSSKLSQRHARTWWCRKASVTLGEQQELGRAAMPAKSISVKRLFAARCCNQTPPRPCAWLRSLPTCTSESAKPPNAAGSAKSKDSRSASPGPARSSNRCVRSVFKAQCPCNLPARVDNEGRTQQRQPGTRQAAPFEISRCVRPLTTRPQATIVGAMAPRASMWKLHGKELPQRTVVDSADCLSSIRL
jgi:hypothetical protein